MKRPFHEIPLDELERLAQEAGVKSVIDTLAHGLPATGMEDGVVVTRYPGDPVFAHLEERIAQRRAELVEQGFNPNRASTNLG